MKAGIGHASQSYQTSALDDGSDTEGADPIIKSNKSYSLLYKAQSQRSYRSSCYPNRAADPQFKGHVAQVFRRQLGR